MSERDRLLRDIRFNVEPTIAKIIIAELQRLWAIEDAADEEESW